VNGLISSSQAISAHGSIDPVFRFAVALDGSGNFTDIQSAIDAVPSGAKGVITVKAGIYDLNPAYQYPFQSIVVKSNLTIEGMGIDRTIITSFPDKQPFGSGIRAMSMTSVDNIENLIIENLTVIQNGTPDNLGWGAIDLRGGANANVQIRNVKVTDVTGAAIEIPQFDNVVVENCTIERAWTGISLEGGSGGSIKGNRIVNTGGDGIFPQALGGLSVTDVMIEGNYLENIGDTGIDITSASDSPPHERITAQNNTLKNACLRVSDSQNVQILANTFDNGYIDVDNGAGPVINVTVEGNNVTSSYGFGIGFCGAQDCQALDNEIYLTTAASGLVQSGISAGIWGAGLIQGNIIVNASNYGIDFAGWGLGGDSNITIRNNTILDFGDIGIFDDNLNQGPYLIENNTILDRREPFVSRYGIRTDYEANVWTIRYNHIYAGTIAFVSAPQGNVYGNNYSP
jgi:parallel beta-helix repeat protein